MKKPKKNSLVNKILESLADKSKELLDLSLLIIFDPHEMVRQSGIYRSYNDSQSLSRIHNLKRSSYFEPQGDRLILTTKGRVEVIKKILLRKKENKKWDDKWRAVIFDIPEKYRRARNFLRTELKWMGFKELQHSIWITPFDIEEELAVLLKLWNKDFKGDIKFLKIEKINDDKDFRKMFRV